jgi:hypothetical protein
MALPPEAAEQVRVLKSLERAILVQADRAAGGSGPLGTLDARDPAWTSDAASRARGGLSLARLDRELRELEALAEEQVRPVDRSAVLAALAERVAARDAVRQMLRELAVRAGDFLSAERRAGGARGAPGNDADDREPRQKRGERG